MTRMERRQRVTGTVALGVAALLAVIVVLLTCEWVGRKLSGLP